MSRRLFCEISPLTYKISVQKERFIRDLKNLMSTERFSKEKAEPLPVVVYKHSSLIRRQLGNVDMQLQENKAANLGISAPKVNGIIIRPKETFSFWHLVGNCTAAKGYKEGLTISLGVPSKGIGGGMCQFTNLLHWLALHSPLDIAEHHHHDNIDIFPDFGRQVPFGCGTSIFYNYKDYQLKNNTNETFQFIVYTTDTHLCGELRASAPMENAYHIIEEDMHFVQQDDGFYRRNTLYKRTFDKRTGNQINQVIIKKSNAKVLYSEEFINKNLIRTN